MSREEYNALNTMLSEARALLADFKRLEAENAKLRRLLGKCKRTVDRSEFWCPSLVEEITAALEGK